MNDPNITIEEYIRLKEEKTRRRAIVFNDTLTSKEALSFQPTVSSLNNDEIDFRISFDESDDEDCTNDAQTSKLDFLTEPTLSPQHIDEFNLKDETSLSKYKDNDDDKIDVEHSSGDMSVIPFPNVINVDVGAYAHGSNKLLETSHDTSRPRERKLMNVGGEFTNLEILKCWSLEPQDGCSTQILAQ
ncbi:hypothetical protein Tco_0266202 [Tanacetum coccineum]